MPPKKPIKVLQLTGAMRKNPKRYKNRKTPAGPEQLGPLGDPPGHLDISAAAVWIELAEIDAKHNRLLCRPDRLIMEVVACTLADYRSNPQTFSSSRLGQLRGMLRSIGMMGPSSRPEVSPPQERSDLDRFIDGENPFANF